MKKLLEEIAQKTKVYQGKGVSSDEIVKAEKLLGISFSDEYKEYLKEVGFLSFFSHEFTGLGVDGYLNVVEATKSERELDKDFPSDSILLENEGIEGILILHDKTGAVYSYANGKIIKISDSLFDFLKSLHE